MDRRLLPSHLAAGLGGGILVPLFLAATGSLALGRPSLRPSPSPGSPAP